MRLVVLFSLLFTLSACFGARAPAPAPVVSPAVAAHGPAETAATTRAINALRAEHGLAALTADPRLDAAAAAHARDMRENGFFGHAGSDGSSVGDRVRREGFGYCFAAENLARGPGRLEEVLKGWMRSPGHRRNLLSVEADAFGFHHGPAGHWVLVLGRAGC